MGGTLKKISVSQIINYYENPRHDVGKDEKDTLRKLFDAAGIQHMINLAKDIYEHGLLENQQIVVVYDEVKKYVVYEGNRRVACIKLLQNPDKFDFLEKSTLDSIRRIIKDGKGSVPVKLSCYVTDEEEAMFIMERIHSGEDKGRGLTRWTPREREIFEVRRKKKKNCAYLINQYMQEYFDGYDITTLMPYTTVQRIFNNIEIKKKIGINVGDESTFTVERMKLVIDVTKWAVKKAEEKGQALTRLYNKSRDIENMILPWLEDYMNKDSVNSKKPGEELNPVLKNLGERDDEQGTTGKEDNNNSETEGGRAQGTTGKGEDTSKSGTEGDNEQENESKAQGKTKQNSEAGGEKGNGGKNNIPYFFQGIQFGNLNPNDPDSHGIAEVCKEIKIFSDKKLVDALPVAAAFLVRSIIEHSINYYSKKHKIQNQEKYIWEDIEKISKLSKKIDKYKHNLPNYITDVNMRAYFKNLFDNYEEHVDPLNWVVHRPEEFLMDSKTLIDLPRRGLLKLINFLIS